jgi:hypothetical protein
MRNFVICTLVIKSRRIRWVAGQATRMVKKKHVFRLPVEKPKRKRTSGELILT